MFTDKDVFKNTAENLNFILETYGDEFRVWAADKVSQEQIQPQGQPQTQEQIQPQIESQSQVQSENFTSGISQHPRLGERFSAFGRHIPNKIFEQVKTLAKKYDGFYDQSFLKSFSFPTAQKRNTFIQHASALIKGKPFEELNSNPDTAPVAQNSLPQAEEKTSKNATPADLENKIYEIIPHDKFITEGDILNRVEEIEPNELPTSLLALEMKGLIEEDAGRYKRTQKLPTANNNAVAKNATEIDKNKRSSKKNTDFLKGIAQGIQEQGDPRQGSLFGESEPAPLIDLIKQARQEVENNGQTTPMFSRNGEVDTTIDNIVDDKDLTPQQKLQQDFGNKLGVQTVFFNNENGDFHGAHANGTSYINVNSKMPIGKVFWHESSHWLKSNNAKLYDELAKAAGITDAQRDAYLKETGRTDLVTDEEIDEEILADQFEDVAKRSGLLQSIAGKNRGLIQRVVQWLKDTMNKFIDHFRNPSGKLTTNQSIALADEFGKIAKDLVDPNGQKIFRYNNRIQNIELADGRGLNAEAQTKKALADLAKAAWNDKNFNGKVSFKPSKKFRDKAQELFGHDIEEVFITGSDIRHIKKKHGENEDARGQIDMTPEMIPDIYDVVNDFDIAEEGKTDKVGQKAIEVTKNINGGQGYVITVERGTKKAEVKTALKQKKPQVLDTKGSEQNVRNDPATSSDENIPQGEDKIKYSIGNSDNEHSWLKGLAKKLGKALHLNGDKIITEEDRRKAHLQEQEKAMADYLKEPSKDNKYRLNKLGVTKGQLQAYMNGEEYLTGIGLRQNAIASPSRIADKVAVFRAFFRMGDRAMDKLVKLRDSFSRKYDSAMDLVKSKEEREKLFEILWDGDEEQKVFTKEELLQDGVSENVANAYIAIRRQMNRAYTLVDEAKRRPQNYAKYLSDKQYEKLRDNKFVKQNTLKIHDTQDEDGRHLVTWTDFFANYEREYTLNKNALDKFKADDAIQILDEKQLEDGTYKVTVREGIPALTNRKGYIPYFFHEYHVTVKNADGKQIGDIIGTGRTQREAIKIAEQWQKNHTLKDGENIHITPRTFNTSAQRLQRLRKRYGLGAPSPLQHGCTLCCIGNGIQAKGDKFI